MKIVKMLATFAQMVTFLVIGVALILLVFNLFSWQDVSDFLSNAYTQPNVKLALGIVGAIFILGGLLIAQGDLSRMQREKTIAFENPDGEVTVSLSAIEDFIRKAVRQLHEVKELRSNVTAGKKGIDVVCRATIHADSNIPQTTEKIQSMVKSRVHEMLGVEEAINIKIHVTKISSDESPRREPRQRPEKEKERYEESSRPIPFRE